MNGKGLLIPCYIQLTFVASRLTEVLFLFFIISQKCVFTFNNIKYVYIETSIIVVFF